MFIYYATLSVQRYKKKHTYANHIPKNLFIYKIFTTFAAYLLNNVSCPNVFS